MDPQLVKRAQDGDERAFEALVVTVHPKLFGVGFAITRDAEVAEDAVQHALLASWRVLSRLRDRAGFLPWCMGFLVDAARSVYQDDTADAPAEDEAAGAIHGGDPFGSTLDGDQISRAFLRLSFDERAVLALRYLAGFDAEQTAVALRLKPTQAEERTEDALATLGRAIDGDPASTTGLVPQAEGT